MKRSAFAALAVVAVMAAGGVAMAQNDQVSFRLGKNLFIAGNDITITDAVEGDLYAAGRSVRVDGSVAGDVMFGAMSLTVNGDVAGSVRGGGQTVNINGSVGKTVLVGAQEANLNTGNDATANDVMIGASTAYVGRPVAGDIAVGAESLQLYKPVTGNASFQVNTLTADDAATIGGTVAYYAQTANDATQQRLEELAPDRVTFHQSTYNTDSVETTQLSYAMRAFALLVGTLSVVVLGWLVQAFAPATLQKLVDAQRKQYALTLLFGLLFVPLMVVLAIVLTHSLLLFPVAVALGLSLPLWVMIAVASVYRNIGEMVRRGKTDRPYAALLAGWIVILALSLIPYLSGILSFVVIILAAGSLVTSLLNAVGVVKYAK